MGEKKTFCDEKLLLKVTALAIFTEAFHFEGNVRAGN